jgi:hypothetical protein
VGLLTMDIIAPSLEDVFIANVRRNAPLREETETVGGKV